MQTRTGQFPIGFRRGGSAWQKDIKALSAWAKDNKLSVIDVTQDAEQSLKAILDAGLRIGSVDLLGNANTKKLISPQKATRQRAIAETGEFIRSCSAYGPLNYFLVMLPEDPSLPRAENFAYLVESFSELAPVLEENKAKIVIEGWPGPGALCCTPEGYRAFFGQVPSSAMGVNYDPSHLVRMGIDPLRFLNEFTERVYHVHGKDTEILAENLYEYGHEQEPTFGQKIRYGAMHWRYTIPGQGQVRWGKIFQILEAHGYTGCVSIELEDANFNGTEAGEKQGLLLGARFLSGC